MTRSSLLPLDAQFDAAWPVNGWRHSHVVLAVSGGADSVAMLRAAVALKDSAGGSGQLFVAHLNHGLRGIEADADEKWLAALCRRLNVPLESAQANIEALAAKQGDGWEAAARAARYEFLRRTAERLGARFVATAHTADDQAETVLHRIIRGTGLSGLAGIPSVRPLTDDIALVRPLLAATRRKVLDHLAAIGQDYRSDSSNADLRWVRNRMRHELLPLLRANFNSDVNEALVRLAAQAADAQQLIANLAAELAKGCVSVELEGLRGVESQRAQLRGGAQRATARRATINCRQLAGQPPIVVREVCKNVWAQANWPQQAMGYLEWQQLAAHVQGEGDGPTLNLPGNVQARRHGDTVDLNVIVGAADFA